jgi:hypothetical protein
MSSLKTMRSTNKLQPDLIAGNYSQYAKSLIPVTAPWLVFLVLSIFGWFCYCLCCCCDKCCPPSKCCRRDLIQRPYTPKEFLWPILAMMVFSILVLGTCIAGLTYAGSIQTGTQSMRCAALDVLYTVGYGANFNTSHQWFGV